MYLWNALYIFYCNCYLNSTAKQVWRKWGIMLVCQSNVALVCRTWIMLLYSASRLSPIQSVCRPFNMPRVCQSTSSLPNYILSCQSATTNLPNCQSVCYHLLAWQIPACQSGSIAFRQSASLPIGQPDNLPACQFANLPICQPVKLIERIDQSDSNQTGRMQIC